MVDKARMELKIRTIGGGAGVQRIGGMVLWS